jgi:hypothetical protein
MIPLAAWAGLPSTACLCANGGIKLVCSHSRCGANQHAGREDHSALNHRASCCSHCCGASSTIEAAESAEVADCCAGHDAPDLAHESSIHSKACCKPILSAPSMAPKGAKAPHDATLAIAASDFNLNGAAQTHVHHVAPVFDTGPPPDRVILFRSLLI